MPGSLKEALHRWKAEMIEKTQTSLENFPVYTLDIVD